MKRIFSDRSRIETYQHCKRRRWHEYHEASGGITPKRKPLPLAVGGSVHEGQAVLLERGQALWLRGSEHEPMGWMDIEEAAVKSALEDFSQFSQHLQVDLSEQAGLEGGINTLEAQLLKSLGYGEHTTDEQVSKLAEMRERSINAFDRYLFEEQSALVEGLVRAYARRRLRPLLDQYEVLEVEREGEWLLSESGGGRADINFGEGTTHFSPGFELWFMSRPDALLLERSSRNLYLLSFKTAASWDIRKDRDATRDMQGLSEGVEVEKRLARWWELAHTISNGWQSEWPKLQAEGCTPSMGAYLAGLKSPPRILGIRYEYMLKGDRIYDKELTAELGLDARTQRSPLTRAYMNPGMVAGEESWNVSWQYLKEGGEQSNLYWKSWHGTPVFRYMKTKQWVDRLEQTVETIGEENRAMGWTSKGQATGFLKSHPLDDLFIPPIVVYRNDDELRDWIEQVEAQERAVAEHVEQVRAAKDAAEKRHLLNIHFPQHRRACEYPSTCPFAATPTSDGPCFGSSMMFEDPLGGDRYMKREPNHPQEVVEVKK